MDFLVHSESGRSCGHRPFRDEEIAGKQALKTMPDWLVPGLPVDTGRRRILLVDDDPALRLLLRTTLGLDEFAIEEASSAEEAAQVGRFWLPAAVILDIGLPGMDGFRFCRELKKNPRYGSPFVLLLTGQEASREETERAGADAVLRKPFSPIELVGLLDRLGETGTITADELARDDAEKRLVA